MFCFCNYVSRETKGLVIFLKKKVTEKGKKQSVMLKDCF